MEERDVKVLTARKSSQHRYDLEKRGVWLSISAYLLMAAVKLGFGWHLAIQSLAADGWNNVTDLIGSCAILIGLVVASKPADGDHRYGHTRAETAAALVAALLMGIVGVQVLQSAALKLWEPDSMQVKDTAGIYVALASAAVIYGVYRVNRAIGEKTNNLAVIAAAYDNRSDAYVSLGTAAGILATQWGFGWADPLFALVVAILILKTAWEVGSDAVHYLMDGFDVEKLSRIEEMVEKVEGVLEIIDLRARYQGSAVYVDVTIGVDPHLNVVESHLLTEQVEKRLIGQLGIERVYVHVEPASAKVCL